jgi:hypothetical protein
MNGKGEDEVLRDAILMNRELLLHKQLRMVIRKGDVGHLESLMAPIALTFKGAGRTINQLH